MPDSDLAPSDGCATPRNQAQDPFASPRSLVQPPEPCAPMPNHAQRLTAYAAVDSGAHTDTGHERTPSHTTCRPYNSFSMSSGSSSLTTPKSSMDPEKSSFARDTQGSRSQYDPEKAMYPGMSGSQQPASMRDDASASYSEGDGDEDGRRRQERNAIKILLFLSGPCVVLSALNTAWTCIAIVITLLTQPVRLCAKRPTFGLQLAGLLGPALNLQLRCIYTPLPPHANEDRSYHVWILVAVHMLSPFLSLGMMLVAWVVAVYWVSSAVVDDPAGMDKRDDGRETALALRGWWEAYLMRSVKADQEVLPPA